MCNNAKGGARLQQHLHCMYAANDLPAIGIQLKGKQVLKIGGVEAKKTYHYPNKYHRE